MAQSCKQQQERIEETVVQPIDRWLQALEQRCRTEPCNWWMLCLNKLFCWLAWALVKVTEWILIIVVRWVYRVICTAVSLVIGLLALVTGDTSTLLQAFADLWELTKDLTYAAIGAIIYEALRIVDVVQTIIRRQPPKRALTERERELLWPVFRASLNYQAIDIVQGDAGLLGISGRAFTMGFTIYLPKYSEATVVHECVHVWQFQFEGFRYIGNSALNQLDATVGSSGYSPYRWVGAIDAGASWYTLKSAEAQAQLIEDAYTDGAFVFANRAIPDAVGSGAFYREDADAGTHRFQKDGRDYTKVAHEAWLILRTG